MNGLGDLSENDPDDEHGVAGDGVLIADRRRAPVRRANRP
jgi:hypothetical protein